MNTVIVGGGKASLVMLDYLTQDPEVDVIGIVDLDDNAPGMVKARSMGIQTFNDFKPAIKRPAVSVVLELTGNTRVREMIRAELRPNQELMTAGGARMLSDIAARATEGHNGEIRGELRQLTDRMTNTIREVDQAADEIGEVLRAIRILALNGNVEAARAGAAGAAFAVVVNEMHGLVGRVERAVQAITTSSDNAHSVLDALRDTEARLKSTGGMGL